VSPALASDARHGLLLLLGVRYGEETKSILRVIVGQVSTVATVGAGTVLRCFSGAVSSNGCSHVVRLSLPTNRVGLPWRQRRLLGHNEVPAMGGQNIGINHCRLLSVCLSAVPIKASWRSANSDTINCLQHSGHYVYRQLNIHICTFCPHSVFMCFVWI